MIWVSKKSAIDYLYKNIQRVHILLLYYVVLGAVATHTVEWAPPVFPVQ